MKQRWRENSIPFSRGEAHTWQESPPFQFKLAYQVRALEWRVDKVDNKFKFFSYFAYMNKIWINNFMC